MLCTSSQDQQNNERLRTGTCVGRDLAPRINEPAPFVSDAGHTILLAYLFQRKGTPSATRELLRDYVQDFADRAGYVLDGIFIGVEGETDRLTVQDLLAHIRACGATTVLVAGPAYEALGALRRLPYIRVLTLRDAQAMKRPAPPG